MPNIGDIIRAEDLQDLLEQINNSSSNIVGELKYLSFNTIPQNCLMCDGSEISRETYSELFNVIGTTYGEGDGSTTFNIPDYRGAFLRCIGGNSESLGIRQEDAIRNITGLQYDNVASSTYSSGALYSVYNNSTGRLYSGGNNGRRVNIYFDASRVVPTADENRPINYAINICIIYE